VSNPIVKQKEGQMLAPGNCSLSYTTAKSGQKLAIFGTRTVLFACEVGSPAYPFEPRPIWQTRLSALQANKTVRVPKGAKKTVRVL